MTVSGCIHKMYDQVMVMVGGRGLLSQCGARPHWHLERLEVGNQKFQLGNPTFLERSICHVQV